MTFNLVSINKPLLILIDLFGLWIAIWVYSADPGKKLNKLFSLLVFSFLFWVNGGYVFSVIQNPDYSLGLGRLILGEVFLFLLFLNLFLFYFPKKSRENLSVLDKIIIVVSVSLFFVATFSKLVVKDVEFEEWGTNPLFGEGGGGFYFVIFILSILTIGQFLKKYSSLVKSEKLKAQYFLVGLVIFIGMNLIFNIFFPLWSRTIRYWQLGNYSAIFLLGFTGYAIVKRELFGIKVVLTTLLVGLIAILLLLDALVFTETFTLQIFKGVILLIFLYFGYMLIQSVLQEIDRRKKIEKMRKELARAYQELKKIDVAKTEFISIASHQLRTPLTVIKGFVSMMLEGSYGKIPEKAVRPLDNVLKSNERLIRLVNDLLTVSKVEMGKLEVVFEKARIEEIIEGLVDELSINAKEKGLYLKWERPATALPKILIDKDKLRQAIFNIVDNAIKYTEKGGITIKVKSQKSKVKIIIADTGAGMTKAEASKLFASFTRGSAGARLWVEGSGLGLYIAKKFVDYHKGKIGAESKGEGKGSVFHVELPIS